MARLFKINTGQSLIEALLVMGLLAALLPALITGLVTARQGRPQALQRLRATQLLQESFEAVRTIRRQSWDNVSVSGTYHPVVSGSNWTLAPGSETVDNYTRSVLVSDVFRNSQGQIATSGGTLDPSTKAVTVTVSWTSPYPSSISSQAYITRFLDNLAFTHTTEAQFLAGTHSGTTVTNVAGGEVTLSSGGHGDWCNPNLNLASLDLPKNGVANALTAIEGRAFAGTGDNASGVSFANVQITNTDPPVPSILGTYDGFKTNGIFGEADYAYLATNNNSKEVEIVNLTTTPYSEAGWFNTPFSNADATAVYISGNRGYVTAGIWLYVFDLSSKSGSRPMVGFPHLLIGTGTSIVVSGNYAFVSVSGSPIEMQIIDVSNPWSIFQVGYADVNGQDGKRVFINSSATRAYLVTNASASLPEFFVIDTATKSGSRPTLGSYDANGMNPQDLAVVSGNKAIIVGSGGEEYQALDITTETSPTRCGGLNLDTGVNGIASVLEQDGDAYSYIITGDASSEFKIIEGGPGGQYSTSGTYESAVFDPGYSTAFNRLDVSVTKPINTDVQFQIAVADPLSGNCAAASYVFTGLYLDDSVISLDDDGQGYENPGRCFKYRVLFSTTDLNSTPVFSDITVNYSP